MCILFLAYKVHPQYPLIMAANRDEFWDRPAEPAHFWPDAPHLLGGRDQAGGGTWLGVTRQGRVAAVTNYRERPKGQAPRSRGELVRRFLIEQQHPKLYLKRVSSEQMAYNGYNLLLGDMTGIYYHSNRISADQSDPRPLKPGIYGLSNHLLDTPWFKVEKGKRMLKAIVSDHTVSPTRLFELLADQEKAPDDQLPESGIDRELEKRHSPIFIQDTTYGTRCSTLLLVNQEYVWFSERQFSPDYSRFQERSFVFPVEHVVS